MPLGVYTPVLAPQKEAVPIAPSVARVMLTRGFVLYRRENGSGYARRKAIDRRVFFFIGLALIIRALLALSVLLHPSVELAAMQGDNYMGSARYLLSHGDIPDPVFCPGYTCLCALCIRIFAGHAGAALLGLQVVLNSALVGLVYVLGVLFGDRRAATIAAALVAIDPLLSIQSSFVLTEGLYTPLLCLCVLAFACRRRSLIWFVWIGLLTGSCTPINFPQRHRGHPLPAYIVDTHPGNAAGHANREHPRSQADRYDPFRIG